MIGFSVRGRVRIKIRIRVRVGIGVPFNFIVYHRSNCRRSKCRTFTCKLVTTALNIKYKKSHKSCFCYIMLTTHPFHIATQDKHLSSQFYGKCRIYNVNRVDTKAYASVMHKHLITESGKNHC